MAAMLCLGECKAQFFNNMHRYHIFDINGGNNPSQVMIIKTKADQSTPRFGGITFSPVLMSDVKAHRGITLYDFTSLIIVRI